MATAKARKPARQAGETGPNALLTALEGQLSDEERNRVFAGALLALDAAGRQRLFDQLSPSAVAVLKALLEATPATDAAPVVSKARIEQDWRKALKAWSAVIDNASSGQGYVQNEISFSTPDLNICGIVTDLEDAAARLRLLVGPVFESGLHAERDLTSFLVSSIKEIGQGVDEWVIVPEDGFELGPEVTGLILEWEWRKQQHAGKDAFAFLDAIRVAVTEELNEGALHADADPREVEAFIGALPEEARRTMLAGLSPRRHDAQWLDLLASPRTVWSRVLDALAARFEPSLQLEVALAQLDSDWRKSLPILESLAASRDWRESVSIARRASKGFEPDGNLNGTVFDPCQRLLVAEWVNRNAADKQLATRVLKYWSVATRELGEAETSLALQLQASLLDSWPSGDAALDAFRALKAEHGALHAQLFPAWRRLIVGKTLRWYEGDRNEAWAGPLTDAASVTAGGAESLRAGVTHWLRSLQPAVKPVVAETNASRFREKTVEERSREWLAILTLDLPQGAELPVKMPAFHERLKREAGSTDSLSETRRRWLARLDGASLWAPAMDTWRRIIGSHVPEPAAAVSYEEPVAWLAALSEVDRSAFDALVRRWRTDHAQKRKLWDALRLRNLALPTKGRG